MGVNVASLESCGESVGYLESENVTWLVGLIIDPRLGWEIKWSRLR